jgi:hypothetical protein
MYYSSSYINVLDINIKNSCHQSGRARLDNDDNIEIVACCGHGKNGNACVIQRHIHSATSYSFDQEDCQEIWSIRCRKEQYFEGLELEGSQVTRHSRTNKQSAIGEQTPYDKFLVISKSKSTTVGSLTPSNWPSITISHISSPGDFNW